MGCGGIQYASFSVVVAFFFFLLFSFLGLEVEGR